MAAGSAVSTDPAHPRHRSVLSSPSSGTLVPLPESPMHWHSPCQRFSHTGWNLVPRPRRLSSTVAADAGPSARSAASISVAVGRASWERAPGRDCRPIQAALVDWARATWVTLGDASKNSTKIRSVGYDLQEITSSINGIVCLIQ